MLIVNIHNENPISLEKPLKYACLYFTNCTIRGKTLKDPQVLWNLSSPCAEEKTPIYLCPGSTITTLVKKVINANTRPTVV